MPRLQTHQQQDLRLVGASRAARSLGPASINRWIAVLSRAETSTPHASLSRTWSFKSRNARILSNQVTVLSCNATISSKNNPDFSTLESAAKTIACQCPNQIACCCKVLALDAMAVPRDGRHRTTNRRSRVFARCRMLSVGQCVLMHAKFFRNLRCRHENVDTGNRMNREISGSIQRVWYGCTKFSECHLCFTR